MEERTKRSWKLIRFNIANRSSKRVGSTRACLGFLWLRAFIIIDIELFQSGVDELKLFSFPLINPGLLLCWREGKVSRCQTAKGMKDGQRGMTYRMHP